MTGTAPTMELAQEFRKAYVKLQAALPPITEDATGQDGNRKFQYAPLDQIMPKVLPEMVKHGFGIYHQIRDETLHSTLFHESGGCIESDLPLGLSENWKHNGAAITYARRYNTLALLNLTPTGEDNLEQQGNVRRKPQQKATAGKATSGAAQKQGNATSFDISHVDSNGAVTEATYPRTPKGIKDMIDPFEDSMNHDPQIWLANRDAILGIYNADKTKGIEIYSPSMGNMTFGEWCETINNRMQDSQG